MCCTAQVGRGGPIAEVPDKNECSVGEIRVPMATGSPLILSEPPIIDADPLANQLPTADETFGPASLPIDETFPPRGRSGARDAAPRRGPSSIWAGGFKCRYRTNQQAVFLLTSLRGVTARRSVRMRKLPLIAAVASALWALPA